MGEMAMDFGGDKTYARVSGMIKKADLDPTQALKEMDAFWIEPEIKKTAPLVQLYALLLARAGRTEEALKVYRSLPVEAHKNIKSSLMLKARAEFLWKLGLKEEAAKDITIAAILNPKDASIRISKTMYLGEVASPERVLAEAEMAIRNLPDNKSSAKVKDAMTKQMEETESEKGGNL